MIEGEYRRIFSPYILLETDHIGLALKAARDFAKASRYPMRDFELDKLDFFLRNLKDIENHDRAMFETRKRRLINVLSKGDSFGIRLEIMTCSNFIRNRVDFDPIPANQTESTPDFVIHTNPEIFVECGSIHLEGTKEGDLTFKIRRAIRDKSAKPYANHNTALFIDTTNIFYHGMIKDPSLEGNLSDDVSKMLEDTKFGSVLLFRYLFENRPSRTLIHGYNRFDNRNIHVELLNFLNANFPLGVQNVDKFFQPARG
jgi:hypothetical protein